MSNKIYCQGDVMIRPISTVPAAALDNPIKTDNGRVILAYGELTGHSHSLDGKLARLFGLGEQRMLQIDQGDVPAGFVPGETEVIGRDVIVHTNVGGSLTGRVKFLADDVTVVDGGVEVPFAWTALVHQEHDAIGFRAGFTGEVIQQRTYARGKIERVAD